jgi:hypothetical protein
LVEWKVKINQTIDYKAVSLAIKQFIWFTLIFLDLIFSSIELSLWIRIFFYFSLMIFGFSYSFYSKLSRSNDYSFYFYDSLPLIDYESMQEFYSCTDFYVKNFRVTPFEN